MPDRRRTEGRTPTEMLGTAQLNGSAIHENHSDMNTELKKSKSAHCLKQPAYNSDPTISLHKKRFSLAEKRDSIADEVRYLKDRASQLIIHVPVENLKKIANTAGMNSLSRETQYFCGICTMHGPLRVYRGKNYSRLFWTTMVTLNAVMLIWQNTTIIKEFVAKPTASQVFFILPEDGIPFPSLTICSYNSIRKSFVQKLNESGTFSEQLLDYVKQSFVEVETFYANANSTELENGMLQYENYISDPAHQNFSFTTFYNDSGFRCEDMLKICTFGGRKFDCCAQAESLLTDLGRCYLIQLSDSVNVTLQKQTEAGLNSGLRMIADYQTEELLDGAVGDEPQPFLSNGFENGFRYFIHGVDEISYLSHEGISVSPGFSVDTAVGPSKFLLLDQAQWGNCTSTWPQGYSSKRLYSAAKCRAVCKARYFNEQCGCSPYFYNIDGEYRVCSPYETYICIRNKFSDENKFVPPKCLECKMECERWVYHSYNSYGHGFSNDALSWLHSQPEKWTPAHIRTNFAAINIAYLDMSYTVYSQVQTTTLSQVLSNIGGNMGLFLGMSVLSCAEIIMFLAKMTWIMISRKRRQYMLFKKEKEEEHERRLKETIEAVHRGSLASETPPTRKISAIDRFKRLGSQIAKRARKATFLRETLGEPHDGLEDERQNRRAAFFDNFVQNRLYNSGPIDTFANSSSTDSTENDQVLELKIDLKDLYRQRSPSLPIPCVVKAIPNVTMSEKRYRSPSDPPPHHTHHHNDVADRIPVLGTRHCKSAHSFLDDYYIEVPEQITEVDEESGAGSPLNSPTGRSPEMGKKKPCGHSNVRFALPDDISEETEEEDDNEDEKEQESRTAADTSQDRDDEGQVPKILITPEEQNVEPGGSKDDHPENEDNDKNRDVDEGNQNQKSSSAPDILPIPENTPVPRKYGSTHQLWKC